MALIFQSAMLDLLALFAVISGAVYLYAVRHFNHWKKRNIPYMRPSAFFGNFKEIVLSRNCLGGHLMDCYLQNKGKPFVGLFAFDEPILLVRDLDFVKNILVKDFQYFMDRSFKPDNILDPLTAKSLFGITGNKWRLLRAKLTPTFTSGKMKKMFCLVDACGSELATLLEINAIRGEAVDVQETLARYSTDVIASCAFGIETKSLQNPNSMFRQKLKKIFDMTTFQMLKMTAAFFAPGILLALRLRVTDKEVTDYVRDTVWDVVEVREKNGIVRNDFLELMMEVRKKGHSPQTNGHDARSAGDHLEMEGDDFVAQSFIFLAAGFETSSTTMTFALYELALQPECQDRLRAEIQEVLAKHDGKVTYEAMQEMNYLDMVVSETLRKYPPLPFLDRKCVKEYPIPGSDITLEKGTRLFISMYGIQMDPEYHPKPEHFDPERFTEENKRARPNYTYFPFGEGPRNCIGMRFGLMQAKTGMIHILNRFTVSPCKETPVPMVFSTRAFLLAPATKIPLLFTKL